MLVALDVSVEEAELKAQRGAGRARARRSSARMRALERATAPRPRWSVDRARAERDVALAQIARTKAVIARKTIRAPFRARVGIADVHPGQYLNEGTELTTLQGVDDAAHVDFTVAQHVAAGLRDGRQRRRLRRRRRRRRSRRRSSRVDARVDPATRNAMVRARIDGAAGAPAPGASVRVRVPVGPAAHGRRRPGERAAQGPGRRSRVRHRARTRKARRARTLRRCRAAPLLGDEVLIHRRPRSRRAGRRVGLVQAARGRAGRDRQRPAARRRRRQRPRGQTAEGHACARSPTSSSSTRSSRSSSTSCIVLVGWRALDDPAGAAVPEHRELVGRHHDRLHRRQRRDRARLPDHADRARRSRRSAASTTSSRRSRAGVSTVTVRLKLNHNSTAALAEVTARLQQVRSELPAEAEPPVVEVQRADRPYASFYLSFTSTERDVPAITDWLARTLQPQLATLDGRAARQHRGRPAARDARLDRSRSPRRAQPLARRRARRAAAQQLPRRRRPDQGQPGAGQPAGEHRPALGRGVRRT